MDDYSNYKDAKDIAQEALDSRVAGKDIVERHMKEQEIVGKNMSKLQKKLHKAHRHVLQMRDILMSIIEMDHCECNEDICSICHVKSFMSQLKEEEDYE